MLQFRNANTAAAGQPKTPGQAPLGTPGQAVTGASGEALKGPSGQVIDAWPHVYVPELAEEAAAVRGQHVLVTGALGMMGLAVVSYCAELGVRVVATDRLEYGVAPPQLADSVLFVPGDLRDAAFVKRLFDAHARFDVVFHLDDDLPPPLLSHHMRVEVYDRIVTSTAILANAVAHSYSKRLVLASSVAVYGPIEDGKPLDEETSPTEPNTPYGIAKLAAELEVKALHQKFGTEYLIFRMHDVYGPHQKSADGWGNVVDTFFHRALRGMDLM